MVQSVYEKRNKEQFVFPDMIKLPRIQQMSSSQPEGDNVKGWDQTLRHARRPDWTKSGKLHVLLLDQTSEHMDVDSLQTQLPSHQTVMSTPPLIVPSQLYTSSEHIMWSLLHQSTLKLQQSPQSLPEITHIIAFRTKTDDALLKVLNDHCRFNRGNTLCCLGQKRAGGVWQESGIERTPKKKSANQNNIQLPSIPCSWKLDIADEDAMDKGKFADQCKVHKRKHDSDEMKMMMMMMAFKLDQLGRLTYQSRMKGMTRIWRDTDNGSSFPKCRPTMWFKPIPESERHNRVGDLQLGIEKLSNAKVNLKVLNWDAAGLYFKEDYTMSQPGSCYRDDIIKEVDEAEVSQSLVMGVDRAWRPGSGQRMTREEQSTSSSYREMTTDQKEEYIEVGKLCWRKSKEILTCSASIEFSMVLWKGELYKQTDHAFYLIGVIRLVRIGYRKDGDGDGNIGSTSFLPSVLLLTIVVAIVGVVVVVVAAGAVVESSSVVTFAFGLS
ncbi:hypothetical protein Tco_0098870 [Tanacetum coccineum]